MAYTNTDTNMTTSTGLAPGMQTYYNRELLRVFEREGIADIMMLVIIKTLSVMAVMVVLVAELLVEKAE